MFQVRVNAELLLSVKVVNLITKKKEFVHFLQNKLNRKLNTNHFNCVEIIHYIILLIYKCVSKYIVYLIIGGSLLIKYISFF